MKRLLLLLALMLVIPLGAQAMLTVPEHITQIEDEAFAGTAIDALIIPSTVKTVGANILQGGQAAYILTKSADTVFSADAAKDVAYVIAPQGSNASGLPVFRAVEKVVKANGLYFYVTETAEPLCLVDPCTAGETVTIPKVVNGVLVDNLDHLYLGGTAVKEVQVPSCMPLPTGYSAVHYQAMTVAVPHTDSLTTVAGRSLTWLTEVQGSYGEVVYCWTFTCGDESTTRMTSEPVITYPFMQAGDWTVSVTVQDALGDTAAATTEAFTLVEAQPVYRALLIGNTYPGAINNLPGPDNDLFSVLTVLNGMSGTPYRISSAQNLTAVGIQAAIATTFAGAQPCDVSLLYFSGHGESNGALVGTNNTFLSVYALRTALQRIPGTKIVILDCCYSGNMINRSGEAEANPSDFNRSIINAFSAISRSAENLEDTGYVVITACSKEQQSNTMVDKANAAYFGVFTYGLCYGSGYDEWNRVALGNLPADGDNNGAITLTEAVAGARERVNYIRQMLPTLNQDVQYFGDPAFILWSK